MLWWTRDFYSLIVVHRYPVRAHSCLQYLQQFLTIQESFSLQLDSSLVKMQQQRQEFIKAIDSLNPSDTTKGSPARPMQGVCTQLTTTTTSPKTIITASSQSHSIAPPTNSNTKKRSFESTIDPPLPDIQENAVVTEDLVNLIVAQRVALSKHTDDFGIPAYTTDTRNGVSLVSLDFFHRQCWNNTYLCFVFDSVGVLQRYVRYDTSRGSVGVSPFAQLRSV
jgi:hypothetical protein